MKPWSLTTTRQSNSDLWRQLWLKSAACKYVYIHSKHTTLTSIHHDVWHSQNGVSNWLSHLLLLSYSNTHKGSSLLPSEKAATLLSLWELGVIVFWFLPSHAFLSTITTVLWSQTLALCVTFWLCKTTVTKHPMISSSYFTCLNPECQT